jgi:hypothetical protein
LLAAAAAVREAVAEVAEVPVVIELLLILLFLQVPQ